MNGNRLYTLPGQQGGQRIPSQNGYGNRGGNHPHGGEGNCGGNEGHGTQGGSYGNGRMGNGNHSANPYGRGGSSVEERADTARRNGNGGAKNDRRDVRREQPRTEEAPTAVSVAASSEAPRARRLGFPSDREGLREAMLTSFVLGEPACRRYGFPAFGAARRRK